MNRFERVKTVFNKLMEGELPDDLVFYFSTWLEKRSRMSKKSLETMTELEIVNSFRLSRDDEYVLSEIDAMMERDTSLYDLRRRIRTFDPHVTEVTSNLGKEGEKDGISKKERDYKNLVEDWVLRMIQLIRPKKILRMARAFGSPRGIEGEKFRRDYGDCYHPTVIDLCRFYIGLKFFVSMSPRSRNCEVHLQRIKSLLKSYMATPEGFCSFPLVKNHLGETEEEVENVLSFPGHVDIYGFPKIPRFFHTYFVKSFISLGKRDKIVVQNNATNGEWRFGWTGSSNDMAINDPLIGSMKEKIYVTRSYRTPTNPLYSLSKYGLEDCDSEFLFRNLSNSSIVLALPIPAGINFDFVEIGDGYCVCVNLFHKVVEGRFLLFYEGRIVFPVKSLQYKSFGNGYLAIEGTDGNRMTRNDRYLLLYKGKITEFIRPSETTIALVQRNGGRGGGGGFFTEQRYKDNPEMVVGRKKVFDDTFACCDSVAPDRNTGCPFFVKNGIVECWKNFRGSLGEVLSFRDWSDEERSRSVFAQGLSLDRHHRDISLDLYSPHAWKNVIQTLYELEKYKDLREFSDLLGKMNQGVFSCDPFYSATTSSNNNERRPFPKSYRKMILLLLLINQDGGNEFGKIPKDVLVHKIIPFLGIPDIYFSFSEERMELRESVRLMCLSNVIRMKDEENAPQCGMDIRSALTEKWDKRDDFLFLEEEESEDPENWKHLVELFTFLELTILRKHFNSEEVLKKLEIFRETKDSSSSSSSSASQEEKNERQPPPPREQEQQYVSLQKIKFGSFLPKLMKKVFIDENDYGVFQKRAIQRSILSFFMTFIEKEINQVDVVGEDFSPFYSILRHILKNQVRVFHGDSSGGYILGSCGLYKRFKKVVEKLLSVQKKQQQNYNDTSKEIFLERVDFILFVLSYDKSFYNILVSFQSTEDAISDFRLFLIVTMTEYLEDKDTLDQKAKDRIRSIFRLLDRVKIAEYTVKLILELLRMSSGSGSKNEIVEVMFASFTSGLPFSVSYLKPQEEERRRYDNFIFNDVVYEYLQEIAFSLDDDEIFLKYAGEILNYIVGICCSVSSMTSTKKNFESTEFDKPDDTSGLFFQKLSFICYEYLKRVRRIYPSDDGDVAFTNFLHSHMFAGKYESYEHIFIRSLLEYFNIRIDYRDDHSQGLLVKQEGEMLFSSKGIIVKYMNDYGGAGSGRAGGRLSRIRGRKTGKHFCKSNEMGSRYSVVGVICETIRLVLFSLIYRKKGSNIEPPKRMRMKKKKKDKDDEEGPKWNFTALWKDQGGRAKACVGATENWDLLTLLYGLVQLVSSQSLYGPGKLMVLKDMSFMMDMGFALFDFLKKHDQLLRMKIKGFDEFVDRDDQPSGEDDNNIVTFLGFGQQQKAEEEEEEEEEIVVDRNEVIEGIIEKIDVEKIEVSKMLNEAYRIINRSDSNVDEVKLKIEEYITSMEQTITKYFLSNDDNNNNELLVKIEEDNEEYNNNSTPIHQWRVDPSILSPLIRPLIVFFVVLEDEFFEARKKVFEKKMEKKVFGGMKVITEDDQLEPAGYFDDLRQKREKEQQQQQEEEGMKKKKMNEEMIKTGMDLPLIPNEPIRKEVYEVLESVGGVSRYFEKKIIQRLTTSLMNLSYLLPETHLLSRYDLIPILKKYNTYFCYSEEDVISFRKIVLSFLRTGRATFSRASLRDFVPFVLSLDLPEVFFDEELMMFSLKSAVDEKTRCNDWYLDFLCICFFSLKSRRELFMEVSKKVVDFSTNFILTHSQFEGGGGVVLEFLRRILEKNPRTFFSSLGGPEAELQYGRKVVSCLFTILKNQTYGSDSVMSVLSMILHHNLGRFCQNVFSLEQVEFLVDTYFLKEGTYLGFAEASRKSFHVVVSLACDLHKTIFFSDAEGGIKASSVLKKIFTKFASKGLWSSKRDRKRITHFEKLIDLCLSQFDTDYLFQERWFIEPLWIQTNKTFGRVFISSRLEKKMKEEFQISDIMKLHPDTLKKKEEEEEEEEEEERQKQKKEEQEKEEREKGTSDNYWNFDGFNQFGRNEEEKKNVPKNEWKFGWTKKKNFQAGVNKFFSPIWDSFGQATRKRTHRPTGNYEYSDDGGFSTTEIQGDQQNNSNQQQNFFSFNPEENKSNNGEEEVEEDKEKKKEKGKEKDPFYSEGEEQLRMTLTSLGYPPERQQQQQRQTGTTDDSNTNEDGEKKDDDEDEKKEEEEDNKPFFFSFGGSQFE